MHEFKINSSIPKDVTKFFNELETHYKVWIHIG